jgi:hypothetical protein
MAEARSQAAAAEESKKNASAPAAKRQKPVKREAWISGTTPVAKRQATSNSYLARGPGHSRPYYQGTRDARGRGGNQFPRPWKRGFRGGRGRGGGRRKDPCYHNGTIGTVRTSLFFYSEKCKICDTFIIRSVVNCFSFNFIAVHGSDPRIRARGP